MADPENYERRSLRLRNKSVLKQNKRGDAHTHSRDAIHSQTQHLAGNAAIVSSTRSVHETALQEKPARLRLRLGPERWDEQPSSSSNVDESESYATPSLYEERMSSLVHDTGSPQSTIISPLAENTGGNEPEAPLRDLDEASALREVIKWLLDELIEERKSHGSPEWANDRLTSFKRDIINKAQNTSLPMLMQLTMGLEETVNRRSKTVKELLGDVVDWNGNLEFPPLPTPEEISSTWVDLRRSLENVFLFSQDNTLPSKMVACYLAEHTDSILGTNASALGLSKWIRNRRMEQQGQHVSQMAISAMFLISVFSPCGDMHDSEAWKVADLYFDIMEQAEGGAMRVEKSRKIGLKLRYDSQNYRETVMQDDVNTLHDTLAGCMEELDLRCHPRAEQDALRELLTSATLFKQRLIVSGKEYKMPYCKPGTPYDGSWMNAFDENGKAIPPMYLNGRKVLLSTFPALLEHDAHPTEPTNFREKRFFFTWKELEGSDLQNLRVVAKATVLLEGEDQLRASHGD